MNNKESYAAGLQLAQGELHMYCDTLRAIGEFRAEIINRIQTVVENRLDDLGKAMNISLKDEFVYAYTDEDRFSGEKAMIGCAIGGFQYSGNIMYFWLDIKYSGDVLKQRIGISMRKITDAQKEFLRDECKRVSNDSYFGNVVPNEIGFAHNFTGKPTYKLLEENLNDLINKWIEVWKGIKEGFNGLPK